MTGKGSRDADNQEIYREIGAFLEAHHLFPAPANYALLYQVITEPDSPAALAVKSLIADGVRLSQEDADHVRVACGIDAGGAASIRTQESLAQARRQIDDFELIVETARTETGSYGDDLERGAAELAVSGIEHAAVAKVVSITGGMVDRARALSAQLEAAREEAGALRRRLAEAEEEALRDPLTRLPNRRAFEAKLAETLEKGVSASLAICDVDRFKRINDSHGHSVGDRVLRMVADVLRDCCGDHMVARIGGEEFVVLFENVAPDAAGALLDEAREDLASRDFRVRGTDAPLGKVTFSAGIAHCEERGGLPPLKRADDLLYRAKNEGRNMVVVEVD